MIFTILVTSRIKSVNLLYLIVHYTTGYLKNGEKYLIIDSTDKYEEVFSGIRPEIKTLNGGKELFYGEKKYARIEVDIDDDLSLNKQTTKISNSNNNH